MAPQFEAFPDPLDNWIVWDLERDDFAMLGSIPANYLSQDDAIAACKLLNRIAARRNEESSAA
jgi:hypothetical protein